MEVTLSKLPKSEIELNITVSKETVEEYYQKTLLDIKKRVEISGFRRGLAPLNLVEEKVGKDKIEQEALRDLLNHFYFEALNKEKISPLTDPEIAVIDFELGKNLIFKAKVAVLTEVKIGNYNKIKIKKEKPKDVDEIQVEEALKRVKENYQKNPQDFIYDAQGNKVSLVKEDAMAEKLGFKDLTDLKNKIKEELEVQEKYIVEKEFEEKLFVELLKISDLEIPEILVAQEVNRMLANFNKQLNSTGAKLEEYLAHKGKTLEALKEEWHDSAQKSLKIELILREITRLEGIQVSEKEVLDQLPKEHSHQEHTPEQKAQEEAFVKHMMQQNKTLLVLKEKAQRL